MAAAVMAGGVWYAKGPDGKQYPAAVLLAVQNIEKWEGFAPVAYMDRIASPPICTFGYGETKGCKMGMKITRQQAEALLLERVNRDFYLPMTKCVKGLETKPVGPQASMIMGAYNFGEPRWCHSTAARLISQNRFREACAAQTAFNRAGGKIINGLVRRREMGDAQRIGEAELCLSGI
jgi:GH24 family phage-related lysozyme (muramidase)